MLKVESDKHFKKKIVEDSKPQGFLFKLRNEKNSGKF